mgnify:FL=1
MLIHQLRYAVCDLRARKENFWGQTFRGGIFRWKDGSRFAFCIPECGEFRKIRELHLDDCAREVYVGSTSNGHDSSGFTPLFRGDVPLVENVTADCVRRPLPFAVGEK